ncbi:hypothetical protein [uncultured Alistipes sp.]|uniref:hypothetical protein n=1 Tax=uncultured Alistipes sp. TaxID=538949 RepID=UPI003209E021
MEYILYIIVIVVLIYFIYKAIYIPPGHDLNKKFINLGTLQGKTYDEIIKEVGPPSASETLENGQSSHLWHHRGYMIRLIFDKHNICLGINEEIKWRN